MKGMICICGGGSLSHVIAGFLANKNDFRVNVLTRHPELWKNEIIVDTPDGKYIKGQINKVSSNPVEVVPNAQIVLLCLPGFAIKEELLKINKYLSEGSFVGSVFSSTGFFFEAFKCINRNVNLWGFQRVPFVARTQEYGYRANLLGFKDQLRIAIEGEINQSEKEGFRFVIEDMFQTETILLNNYLEASLSNSNPLLHTSRLYSIFKDYKPGDVYEKQYLFYEEWSDEASELLVEMDKELFRLLKILPVSSTFLEPILEHYDSTNPHELTCKIRSIQSFKGLLSPMINTRLGWIPDFTNRYFVEDFQYGLRYIYDLMHEKNVNCVNIDEVYNKFQIYLQNERNY